MPSWQKQLVVWMRSKRWAKFISGRLRDSNNLIGDKYPISCYHDTAGNGRTLIGLGLDSFPVTLTVTGVTINIL
jgi:hypothetical protein